jgi:hypothetical protein
VSTPTERSRRRRARLAADETYVPGDWVPYSVYEKLFTSRCLAEHESINGRAVLRAMVKYILSMRIADAPGGSDRE